MALEAVAQVQAHEDAYRIRKEIADRALRIEKLSVDRSAHLALPKVCWPSMSPEMQKGEERVARQRRRYASEEDYVWQ